MRTSRRHPFVFHATLASALTLALALAVTVLVFARASDDAGAIARGVFPVPWLIAANVVAFGYFGYDKARARREGARRVPEAALVFTALILGDAGALLGMLVFRHKTRKRGFQLALGAVVALHAGALAWVLASRH